MKIDKSFVKNLKELPEYKYKTIDGIKIAYRENGKGPYVFCIPSWLSTANIYYPFSEGLKDSFTVVSFDMPGFGGRSDKLKKWGLDNMADLTLKFIESFNVSEYSIVGYSLGGVITQYLLSKSLIRPSKIALVSTFHSGSLMYSKRKRELDFVRTTLKYKFPGYLLREIINTYRFFNRGRIKLVKELSDSVLLKELLKQQRRYDVKAAFQIMFDVQKLELLNHYPKDIKTLIITGERDIPFVRKDSEDFANYLGIKNDIIKGYDHDHLLFEPSFAIEKVSSFLKNN